MGRGAFAMRYLPKGTVIAPAPMQIFKNGTPERRKQEALVCQLLLNRKTSDMLLFPYGPAVNK
jgi:hypothetical protein